MTFTPEEARIYNNFHMTYGKKEHECEGCQTTKDTYSTGGGLYICKACDDKNALEYTVGLLQELIKDGLCDADRAERAIEIISEQNNL